MIDHADQTPLLSGLDKWAQYIHCETPNCGTTYPAKPFPIPGNNVPVTGGFICISNECPKCRVQFGVLFGNN